MVSKDGFFANEENYSRSLMVIFTSVPTTLRPTVKTFWPFNKKDVPGLSASSAVIFASLEVEDILSLKLSSPGEMMKFFVCVEMFSFTVL